MYLQLFEIDQIREIFRDRSLKFHSIHSPIKISALAFQDCKSKKLLLMEINQVLMRTSL
jgi:hypothetical protein